MKNGRTVGVMLAIANTALAIVSVVLYIGTDRTEPRFEFMETDIIYEAGMEESRLLEGISAYDNEDGDLTDKIVVEKRIENQEQNLAVIFYAVSDKAGNVAKCSREFTAVYRTETGEAGSVEAQESPLVQSGVWSVLEGDGAEGKTPGEILEKAPEEDGNQDSEDGGQEGKEEEDGEEPGEEGNEDAAEAEGENEEAIEGENGNDTGEGEGTGQGEQNQEREAEQERRVQERNEQGRNAADAGAPVLKLKVSEVTTQAGVAPAWVNVIEVLSDDKDNYETLFKNLEVSKYNINQAGTYQVNVSTKDSDGNKSRAVPLTIIVR